MSVDPTVDEPTDRELANPTFGFELEFARNANAIAAELHARGLCGGDNIHGWHCDCGLCEDDSFDFKVQSDSTVDGEVISRVFTDIDDGTTAMRELQDAAVKVDAEPGLNAGLHVHVAKPTSQTRRVRALLAFLVWEDAITTLAQGRFPHIRAMNTRVFDGIMGHLGNVGIIDYYDGDVGRQTWEHLNGLVAECSETPRPTGANDLYRYHLDADRHSNLNINTRFGTWEFRIWNATRSAWRMELAVRLALAWYDPDFIDALLDPDVGGRTPEKLRDIVATVWQRDDTLASLIDRQVDYLPHSASAPHEFLVA